MRIDENFDKLLKKVYEFEKKEFPMGIGIIMQEGITNTLIKFGNEILEDCEKESDLKCENKELIKQLEQAKEIIKTFYEYENERDSEINVDLLLTEAKQFFEGC